MSYYYWRVPERSATNPMEYVQINELLGVTTDKWAKRQYENQGYDYKTDYNYTGDNDFYRNMYNMGFSTQTYNTYQDNETAPPFEHEGQNIFTKYHDGKGKLRVAEYVVPLNTQDNDKDNNGYQRLPYPFIYETSRNESSTVTNSMVAIKFYMQSKSGTTSYNISELEGYDDEDSALRSLQKGNALAAQNINEDHDIDHETNDNINDWWKNVNKNTNFNHHNHEHINYPAYNAISDTKAGIGRIYYTNKWIKDISVFKYTAVTGGRKLQIWKRYTTGTLNNNNSVCSITLKDGTNATQPQLFQWRKKTFTDTTFRWEQNRNENNGNDVNIRHNFNHNHNGGHQYHADTRQAYITNTPQIAGSNGSNGSFSATGILADHDVWTDNANISEAKLWMYMFYTTPNANPLVNTG